MKTLCKIAPSSSEVACGLLAVDQTHRNCPVELACWKSGDDFSTAVGLTECGQEISCSWPDTGQRVPAVPDNFHPLRIFNTGGREAPFNEALQAFRQDPARRIFGSVEGPLAAICLELDGSTEPVAEVWANKLCCNHAQAV